MGQLQTVESELLELGYQILAVSPDKPERLAQNKKDKGYSYELASDSSMAGARALGIAWRVDDKTYDLYKNRFKLDLEEHSGQKHHQLPVPAVFLIATDQKIGFQHVDPNYRVRLDPQVLLAVAKASVARTKK